MKVRMKVAISGTRNDSPWPAIGEDLVVSDTEGAELCTQGYADAVASPPKPERTTQKRTEKR